MAEESAQPTFRLLGRLEVERVPERALGGPKQRALLVWLVLHPNQLLPIDRLVDAVWGEKAPPTANAIVHAYVRKLRAALAATSGHIVTRSPGYLLALDEQEVDVFRFERLAREERERLRAGDAHSARELLAAALALWRGDALADVAQHPGAEVEAQRLAALRLESTMDWIDAELLLGGSDTLPAQLEALIAQNPYHERLRAQLMLALYRAGRQAEALAAYHQARSLLVDELGIEPGPDLRRLEQAILRQDEALAIAPADSATVRAFPPQALRAARLPTTGNVLVGRERELSELSEKIADSWRLITITGTGGAGKTRLAVAIGEALEGIFADGVWFVSLAGVQQHRHVAAAVSSAVGVRSFSELQDKQALLILDNFEHVLDAAPVVGALLATAPGIKALVTSRAPLRLDGEREYLLGPLREDDAVALLAERARAVRPGFSPDSATREICQRLDRLPLGLELVATHLRVLAASTLLDRLDRRLPLLVNDRRDAPERHRSLSAAIAWSHDMLDPKEQRLFARLAVFRGTFSLTAGEVVADATVEGIEALVEASLLSPASEDRFFMLETIREFASEQLESHEADELRARHAEFFIALAERANLTVEADGLMDHLLVVPEHDNFRAALEWSLRSGRFALGLQLATALEAFWVVEDPIGGIRWFERLLPLADAVSTELRAAALRVYGVLKGIADDFDEAERLWERSLTESRAAGDERGVASCLFLLAIRAGQRGDNSAAQRLAERSLELHLRTGARKGEAQARGVLGALTLKAGDHERGLGLIEQSIEVAREAGFPWWQKNELCFLAERLLELGRLDRARDRAHEALRLARRIHDRVGQIDSLTIIAHIAAERGEPKIAGRLWGVVEAEAVRSPFPGWARTRRLHAAAVLSGSEFEAARAEGVALAFDDAVEETLAAAS